MERMLRLAAAFNYDDLQTKTPADGSFKMTALLSVIKPTTLKVLIVSLGYHTCYLSLRLVFRKDRPLAINAYYGFDTFNSPIYEMVNLSQVRLQTQSTLSTRCTKKLPKFERCVQTARSTVMSR
jgi:hypothetical protein